MPPALNPKFNYARYATLTELFSTADLRHLSHPAR